MTRIAVLVRLTRNIHVITAYSNMINCMFGGPLRKNRRIKVTFQTVTVHSLLAGIINSRVDIFNIADNNTDTPRYCCTMAVSAFGIFRHILVYSSVFVLCCQVIGVASFTGNSVLLIPHF